MGSSAPWLRAVVAVERRDDVRGVLTSRASSRLESLCVISEGEKCERKSRPTLVSLATGHMDRPEVPDALYFFLLFFSTSVYLTASETPQNCDVS